MSKNTITDPPKILCPRALRSALVFLVVYDLFFCLAVGGYLWFESPEMLQRSNMLFSAINSAVFYGSSAVYQIYSGITWQAGEVWAPSLYHLLPQFSFGSVLFGTLLTFFLVYKCFQRKRWARALLGLLIVLNSVYIAYTFSALSASMQEKGYWLGSVDYNHFSPKLYLTIILSSLVKMIPMIALVLPSSDAWFASTSALRALVEDVKTIFGTPFTQTIASFRREKREAAPKVEPQPTPLPTYALSREAMPTIFARLPKDEPREAGGHRAEEASAVRQETPVVRENRHSPRRSPPEPDEISPELAELFGAPPVRRTAAAENGMFQSSFSEEGVVDTNRLSNNGTVLKTVVQLTAEAPLSVPEKESNAPIDFTMDFSAGDSEELASETLDRNMTTEDRELYERLSSWSSSSKTALGKKTSRANGSASPNAATATPPVKITPPPPPPSPWTPVKDPALQPLRQPEPEAPDVNQPLEFLSPSATTEAPVAKSPEPVRTPSVSPQPPKAEIPPVRIVQTPAPQSSATTAVKKINGAARILEVSPWTPLRDPADWATRPADTHQSAHLDYDSQLGEPTPKPVPKPTYSSPVAAPKPAAPPPLEQERPARPVSPDVSPREPYGLPPPKYSDDEKAARLRAIKAMLEREMAQPER